MAKFSFETIDADQNTIKNTIDIPDFAMESTLHKIALKMGAIEKLSDETKQTIKNQSKTIEEGIKSDKEGREKLRRDFINSLKESEKLKNRAFGNILDNMEKDFRRVGNGLTTVVTALVGLGTVAGGFVLRGFTNLGEGLKTLTAVGGAFGDSLSSTGASAEQNIISLNKLGLTTDQAVNVLSNYSRSMAILGQSSVIGASKSFLELTNYGADLGTTLDEATEFFQEDLQFRTMMLRRDQISTEQSARISAQLNTNLRRFSTLLGINSDEVRKNAQDVISGNTAFRAFAASLGSMGPDVQAGAELLSTGLISSLGSAGDSVADALLRISATGVGAIDEFVNQLNPLAPEAARAIKDVSMQLRNGQITTARQSNEAVLSILDAFDGVDQATINKLIPIIDSVGGELAGTGKILVEAFVNAGTSADKLRKSLNVPIEFSDTQTGLVVFQNTVAKARGSLSAFQNAMATGAAPGLKSLSALFEKLLENQGLADMFEEYGKKFGDTISNFIERLAGGEGKSLNDAVSNIMTGLKTFLDYMHGIFESLVDGFESGGKLDIMGGIGRAIGIGLMEAFKLSIIAIKEAFIYTITHPKVLGAVILGFTTLLAAQALVRGVTTAIVTGFGTLLGSNAVTQAIVRSIAKWGLISTTGTLASTALGTTAATVSGSAATAGIMAKLKGMSGKELATKTVKGAGATAGVIMLGKDVVDLVAGTDGGATGENIGGVAGGVIGGVIGAFGGPVGIAIGAGIGNTIGGLIGGLFDGDKNTSEQSVENSVRAGPNYVTIDAARVDVIEPSLVKLLKPANLSMPNTRQASVNTNIQSVYKNSNLDLGMIDKATDAMIKDGTLTDREKSAIADVSGGNEQISTLILMLEELKRSNRHLSDISNKPSD